MSDIDRYLTDAVVEMALAAGNAASECYYGCPSDMTTTEMHAALAAVLPDVIQQAKAEAWEEGHAAGCTDPYAKYGECGCGPNPYRADRIEQGGQP